MAELNCKVGSCVYNKSDCCCKGDIMVGGRHADTEGKTCCESFAKQRGESYTSALEHPCRTISIDCEASDCAHNVNYKCVAKHVDIYGNGACECGQTTCATFKEK